MIMHTVPAAILLTIYRLEMEMSNNFIFSRAILKYSDENK